MTADLFKLAAQQLAFAKSDKSLLRGVIFDRFFSSNDDDKTWIASVKGLTEEKLASIITETNKWWKVVQVLTDVLKKKQQSNTELQTLLKQFDEANTYFTKKVASHCITKHIDLESKET